MADKPLFNLDAQGRWRLAYDSNQWVLQKRAGSSGRNRYGIRESGWRGVSLRWEQEGDAGALISREGHILNARGTSPVRCVVRAVLGFHRGTGAVRRPMAGGGMSLTTVHDGDLPKASASTPAASRQRRHRARRKQGRFVVPVEVTCEMISALVDQGVVDEDDSSNLDCVGEAIAAAASRDLDLT